MGKINHFQNIIIVLLVVAVVAMSIGFATYTSTQTISGTAEFKKAIWDVHFQTEGAGAYTETSGSKAATSHTVTGNTINFEVSLNVGEFYEFTTTIENKGTFDAKLQSVTPSPAFASTLGTTNTYYTYTCTYNDGSGEVPCDSATNKVLTAETGTATVKVRVEYPVDQTNNGTNYPATDTTQNFSVVFSYVDSEVSA